MDTGAGAGGKTEGWEENMELRVTLPDDKKSGPVPDPSECRLFLIVTLATALTFCLLSACIVVFACYRRFAETRRKNKLGADRDTASIKSNSSAGFKSRAGATEDQNSIQVNITNQNQTFQTRSMRINLSFTIHHRCLCILLNVHG